jgi:hypothetical protein
VTNFNRHFPFINGNSEKGNKKVRQREGASKQGKNFKNNYIINMRNNALVTV